jgi:hypothetical protein
MGKNKAATHYCQHKTVFSLFTLVFFNAGITVAIVLFVKRCGEWRFFCSTEHALEYVWGKLDEEHKVSCPLHIAMLAKKTQYNNPGI